MEMDIVIAVANVKELEERTPIINKLRDEVDNFSRMVGIKQKGTSSIGSCRK